MTKADVINKLAAYHGVPATDAVLHMPVPFGFLTLDDKKALASG